MNLPFPLNPRKAGLMLLSLATMALSPVPPAAPGLTTTFAGVTMPDTIRVQNETLRLNGMGLRSFTFLQVHGYVAGLYVQTPSRDATALMAEAGPKVLRIQYVRSAGLARVRDELRSARARNCASGCSAQDDAAFALLVASARAVRAGDFNTYVFGADGTVQVLFDGQPLVTIQNADFERRMLDGIIGAHPPTAALRDGLLGG